MCFVKLQDWELAMPLACPSQSEWARASYRVLGCSEICTSNSLVQALERSAFSSATQASLMVGRPPKLFSGILPPLPSSSFPPGSFLLFQPTRILFSAYPNGSDPWSLKHMPAGFQIIAADMKVAVSFSERVAK